MDQSPFLNQGLPTNNAVQVKASSSGKKINIIIYFILVILAIALGLGGYFFGLTLGSKAKTEDIENISSEVTGKFVKAEGFIEAGGNVINNVAVRIIYNGKLVAFEEGKSWTLERDGKSVTVSRNGNEIVRYYRITGQNAPLEPVSEVDLENGADVSISAFVDLKGNLSVAQITINQVAAPVEASPDATNNQ